MMEDHQIIVLGPMYLLSAMVLSERKRGTQREKEDITQHTTAIDFIPLATV